MTPEVSTRALVRRLARPFRGVRLAAGMAAATGAAALTLGALGWLVRLGWVRTPAWVLLAWTAALLVLAALLVWALRASAHLTPPWLAGRLEELGHRRSGSVRGFLDAPAPGTSSSLLAAADAAQAAELVRSAPESLRPLRQHFRRELTGGAGLFALGLLLFVSAGPHHGVVAALWHPGRAWEATMAPVALRAAQDTVDRGGSAELHLRAIGRRRVTLLLRAPGEPWRAQAVALDTAGLATLPVGPLRTDLFALAMAGRRVSDTVRVHVRIPAFLGAISVTARYPAYLGLESEPMPLSGDTLLLPAGTRLEVQGEATAALTRGGWVRERDTIPLDIRGRSFSGSFVPAASGEYRLALGTGDGTPLAGDTVRLPVRVVPDSAPVVLVPVPGADTVAPLSMRLPLVVDAQDDHGLRAVELTSWRVSRLGLRDSSQQQAVPLPGGTPDHALLTVDFDFSRRNLLPGDTLHYLVTARDNAPAAHTGRSPEYLLRLPSLSEVRAAVRQASAGVESRMDSLAGSSSRLERQTEDLSRERERAEGGQGQDGSTQESMSYQSAQKAQAIAQSQEQLLQQAEDLKDVLDQLQKSAEAAGLNDPVWQQRLQEIRDELDRALTPELRQRLEELQQALKNLDPQQAREALEKLAQAQKQLREALERSRELFRRAALEGDLSNLAAESRELNRDQQDWNQQTGRMDSTQAQRSERQLAQRADSLAAALQRVAPQTGDSARQARLQAAAQQAAQAGQQMRSASRSMQSGQRQQARRQGQQASDLLGPLGDQLSQERQAMQDAWRQEVSAGLDRALSETSRLTERQLQLSRQLREEDPSSLPAMRGELGALQEGVQKLKDQMTQTAGKNALVSPQISVALSVAQQQMQRAQDAISNATPDPRSAAEAAEQAVDALNAASYQMARSQNQVSGAGSGSGLQEALEQMQQLAGQQGALNQDAASLLPMAGQGAIQQQLRALADRQRAMAERLERLRAQGQLPGAGELAEQARQLSQQLEQGRLDRQTVDRQERLYRRLLDAGRTLQGEQEDPNKERKSTAATGDSVHLPPALRLKLQGDDNTLRMPDWETLQQLSPEERRLVVEYFRRLTEKP